MKKFKDYVKRIIKLINVEEMRILPGHLAFYIVLMIVPIFSIIGVLGSNFGVERIVNSLADNIPDAVLNIIYSALNASANGYNLFFFIIKFNLAKIRPNAITKQNNCYNQNFKPRSRYVFN